MFMIPATLDHRATRWHLARQLAYDRIAIDLKLHCVDRFELALVPFL